VESCRKIQARERKPAEKVQKQAPLDLFKVKKVGLPILQHEEQSENSNSWEDPSYNNEAESSMKG